jgi:hypothetical protein
VDTIRNRAREHLPTVLLTLLSIVQALALELLWGQIRELEYLYEPTLGAIIGWLAIASTLGGILLIWLNYASTVMRFVWVPSTSDSVFPFLIGVLEFAMIDSLGRGELGVWFVLLALIFVVVTVANHMIYRRAREDGSNEEWFGNVERASLSDFYPVGGIAGGLSLFGVYFLLGGATDGWIALLAILVAAGILGYQMHVTHDFWRRSMGER